MLRSLMTLLARGFAPQSTLYYPISSGLGLYKDLAFLATTKFLGYRLVIHHHTYAYIYARDWRVALLDRLVGHRGAHIVHCELMRDDFLATYGSKSSFILVPPTVVSKRFKAAQSKPHAGFVIGFLSNLSLAKGLDDAIATFELLAATGEKIRLILAGPCHDQSDRQLIDSTISRWPNQVEYLGPVYDEAKARFFAEIDAFVFPTRNESWGIVLSEALTAGVPVIARSRGCIPWIVQGACGFVIHSSASFPIEAEQRLRGWMDSPEAYALAQASAVQRSQELEDDADRALPEFVKQMFIVTNDAARAFS